MSKGRTRGESGWQDGLSRRRLLAGIGALAGALALPGGRPAPARAQEHECLFTTLLPGDVVAAGPATRARFGVDRFLALQGSPVPSFDLLRADDSRLGTLAFQVETTENSEGEVVAVTETETLSLATGETIQRTVTGTAREAGVVQTDIRLVMGSQALDIQIIGSLVPPSPAEDDGVLIHGGQYRFGRHTLRVPRVRTPISIGAPTPGDLRALSSMATQVESFYRRSGARTLVLSHPSRLLQALNIDDGLLFYIPSTQVLDRDTGVTATLVSPMAECIAAGGTWQWHFVGGHLVGRCLLEMWIGRGTGG